MSRTINSKVLTGTKVAIAVALTSAGTFAAVASNVKMRRPIDLASRRLSIPAGIGNLVAAPSGARGGGVDDRFSITSPESTFVLDARPPFRWTVCQHASSYVVTIQDTVSSEVIRSPHVTAMRWSPSMPLATGRIYQWQVEAYKGDDIIDARPLPPAPYAHFEVLPASAAASAKAAAAKAGAGTVAAGLAYSKVGALDDAAMAFKVALNHPSQAARAKQGLADVATVKSGGWYLQGR